MIDTAGTFVGAIDALKKEGSLNIYGAVTHPLFSGPAIERIRNSQITNLLVSDTINFKHSDNLEKISVVSVAEIFAEAIVRTHDNESISSLFDIDKG